MLHFCCGSTVIRSSNTLRAARINSHQLKAHIHCSVWQTTTIYIYFRYIAASRSKYEQNLNKMPGNASCSINISKSPDLQRICHILFALQFRDSKYIDKRKSSNDSAHLNSEMEVLIFISTAQCTIKEVKSFDKSPSTLLHCCYMNLHGSPFLWQN